MLNILFSSPIAFLILFPGLLLAIAIHEYAHALAADYLGDPTPRIQGRLTIDPRAHLDPIGTIAILLTRFGWGKPVPFDPYNLKEPIRDGALIALAGPVSNLLLAIILALVINLGILPGVLLNFTLVQLLVINVMLAIFNLIPIHPLDGSKIILAFLPKETTVNYEQAMHRYGTFLLLFMIIPWNGISPASQLIAPIIDVIVRLLV